ncbi:3-hydroxyacyl-CoA dehydrogenase family protein [Streptomyces sp. NPDC051776]|uniref:3-hydroxyacyl-CoA dehydrogenase family protein n=1 Tax=Streptomyces sp. NPDC051776 TaxID=3155414 RepID=UPI003418CADD
MGGQTLVIGVMGLGSLGEGIVRALLGSGPGVHVVGVDHDLGVVRRVRNRLDSRDLSLSTELADLGRADLVIEAVSEDLGVKENVLRRLNSACSPGTVLATASGTLPVAQLAIASGCPERVLGLRFFLPPPYGRSVELVRTSMTSPDAVGLAQRVAERTGSDVVTVGGGPGIAATELVYGYLNHAVAMVEQNRATVEDIDTAMRVGSGLPYGPLQLADLIGLDTVRDTLRILHCRTGSSSLFPALLLDRMVEEGRHGRKSGRGFHHYTDDGSVVLEENTRRKTGPLRDIDRVGVVGAGTMARGIAQAAAGAGLEVTLVARSEEKASAAFAAVDAALAGAEADGHISEGERLDVLGRIEATDDHAALSACDLLIEAVAEELSVKRSVMRQIEAAAKPGAVLATVTSGLSVAAIASATSRPSDVIGLHFLHPVPSSGLVEVVRTENTADDLPVTAHALVRRLGKTAVDCADRPGFIVNALQFPYLNNAIRMLGRTDVTVEEIDTAVTTAFGHPMGPFALLDAIGLDVSLGILRGLNEAAPEARPAPAAPLEQLVAAGYLGCKTGRGFRTAVSRAAVTA